MYNPKITNNKKIEIKIGGKRKGKGQVSRVP